MFYFSDHVQIRVLKIDGNLKAKKHYYTQRNLVTTLLVAHDVKHPDTSVHVLMHHER